MNNLIKGRRICRLFISVAILNLLLTGSGIAQNEDKIQTILETSDVKKLVKADKYIDDADRLIEEANQLYLETFSVQGDYNLDEKTKGKKVEKLEEQARGKITEASVFYQKGHEIKYGVYKTYIEKFWSDYEGDGSAYVNAKLIEEQSNDFYFQALTNRTEANKMPDGNEKIQKLNQATDLENQAIDKQITALGLYYDIDLEEATAEGLPAPVDEYEPYQAETPVAEQPAEIYQPDITGQTELSQPDEHYEPVVEKEPEAAKPEVQYQPYATVQPETATSDQVVINQQMIDMYNRYVISQGRPEDSVPTTGFANVSAFEIEKILDLWNAFLSRSVTEEAQLPQPTAVIDTTAPVFAEETAPALPEIKPEQQEITEEQVAIVDNERQAQQIPSDDKIIYRVQVAANKTELSQGALQRIYYGNKSVEMLEENGWYKYSVGDFNTYAEANKFRKSSGVKNAFIVAYRQGKRFMPGISEKTDLTAESMAPTGEGNMPAGLIFRIQVAAARAQLTKEQLTRIYAGAYAVEVIEEDGWYKYQLFGVRLYSDAIRILKDIPVKGAFISAYEDGNLTNLYKAVVKNRTLERTVISSGRKNLREIEFHVQLAASKFPIKQDDFSQLYSGSEPVALVIEDGWYKYRIKAGNSYNLAKQIKAGCGVEKAFIVSYKQARKINLYEAIRNVNP
ncbi:MAG: hypothetical protein JXR41_10080 [Bacteroidales bacterium]|nr:hypothetical protein [Bacteroidales bacterium]MBN2763428.1 hypothetical protein [Bacteroidales bacterium]